MQLKELISTLEPLEVIGTSNISFNHISDNSNNTKQGGLFFAKVGSVDDSHKYIDQAISNGAIAIICQTVPQNIIPSICYIKVKDSKIALGRTAKLFYEDPSKQLKLIAVTGTCGKTSTVYILYNIFKNLGYKVGLISSVENKVDEKSYKSNLTTPDLITTNSLLKEMVDANCEYCFMEASSHAIEQDRIYGLDFAGVVFTNISHEHLDYHVTFNNYIYAKKKLFDNLNKKSFALVNVDDKHSSVMLQNCVAEKHYYALHTLTEYWCKVVSNTLDGIEIEINNKRVWVNLRGKFNAYNVLAAYSVAHILQQDPEEILIALSKVTSVPGRFQIYKNKQGTIGVIDHAHKPDALKNLLESVRSLCFDDQKIITIIGCGGNRDKAKRPIMAHIASEYSDSVILSSDNPRFEEPQHIIDEMYAGVPQNLKNKVQIIVDRVSAIKHACLIAEKNDVIIMAGKGDEKYTTIKNKKIPLNEMEIFLNFHE